MSATKRSDSFRSIPLRRKLKPAWVALGLLTFGLGYGQQDPPYIDSMAAYVCGCLSNIPEEVTDEVYMEKYFGCFQNVIVEYLEEIEKDEDISDSKAMNAMGQRIGYAMNRLCPNTVKKYVAIANRLDSKTSQSAEPAPVNLVTVGRSLSDYIKLEDVYNTSTRTVVVLVFNPKSSTNGTLHAPTGQYPFVLSDKRGNRYALKSQSGWNGPDANGYGSISLTANANKRVKLYFDKIANVEDVYSLTEVGCGDNGSTSNCWNFYTIKVSKR